ncbi:MAG: hypothetical protein ACRYG7_03590 [Janthinobacterium lividum]
MSTSVIAQLLNGENIDLNSKVQSRYRRLGIRYNPFPKSGTANVLGNSLQDSKLVPVDEPVLEQVSRYVIDSLYAQGQQDDDKFLSAVIVGDYGSGKTQLLMYVKYLLSNASSYKELYKNPYVIYLDNPGVRLSELIGGIVSKIGEENFKKYLWNKIISGLKKLYDAGEKFRKFKPDAGFDLFGGEKDLFAEKHIVNYKSFLSNWISILGSIKQRQDFNSVLKAEIISILKSDFKDGIVSDYLYDLIANDYASGTIWESFSTGDAKRLEKKYVEIISAIVQLVKDQGYTDFFILVDEFEDITQGRLSKSQVDNYLYNLRTLIDHQRQWCLMFAMTGVALEKLRKVSPPLADRIGGRRINIPSLDTEKAKVLVNNYLDMATDSEISAQELFTDSGIAYILKYSSYITRNFLRHCFEILERLADDPEAKQVDENFSSIHLN